MYSQYWNTARGHRPDYRRYTVSISLSSSWKIFLSGWSWADKSTSAPNFEIITFIIKVYEINMWNTLQEKFNSTLFQCFFFNFMPFYQSCKIYSFIFPQAQNNAFTLKVKCSDLRWFPVTFSVWKLIWSELCCWLWTCRGAEVLMSSLIYQLVCLYSSVFTEFLLKLNLRHVSLFFFFTSSATCLMSS